MASGAIDGIINLFDLQSGRLLHTLEGTLMDFVKQATICCRKHVVGLVCDSCMVMPTKREREIKPLDNTGPATLHLPTVMPRRHIKYFSESK